MASVFWSSFGLSTSDLVFSHSAEFCRFTKIKNSIITVDKLVVMFGPRSTQIAFDSNSGHSFCLEDVKLDKYDCKCYLETVLNWNSVYVALNRFLCVDVQMFVTRTRTLKQDS
jgi:hypothetical protein